MNLPISNETLNKVLHEMDIDHISDATIKQCCGVAKALEDLSGTRFSHLEFGVPGLKACQIGVDAQKRALDDGVASIYPNITGIPELKANASEFIKAFINLDINPECIIPTVGSMQGSFNLIFQCSKLQKEKDTILYINPGFSPHMLHSHVLGINYESFDIYNYRSEKLREKLEEYLSKGNVAALLYSNPNNPTWVCLTEEELQIIGECATKYDVIVLEDLAYLGMDFRTDISKPFEAPFQATVANYTDNYVLMLSASKIFSYAGERISLVAFSNKLYKREYKQLKELYGIGRMGESFALMFLYVASSGTSHSAQHAISAMMKAAVNGEYDFVGETREYARRAHIIKGLFTKYGFNIVYDKDGDANIGDGFFFTIGYQGFDNEELLLRLLRCGISAISLKETGSRQAGVRVCVSVLSSDQDMQLLEQRIKMFVEL